MWRDQDRFIMRMRYRWWKARLPFGCVKHRFEKFGLRKILRNACLHARYYHLWYAHSTQRWVFETETVIISEKKNQHSTFSSPPNWQKWNSRCSPTLGDPEEGLEKCNKRDCDRMSLTENLGNSILYWSALFSRSNIKHII